MENLTVDLIRSLVQMHIATPGRIAEESDMDRPSLLAGLAGRRPLARAKIPQLLRVLGIPNGELDSGVVHVWIVGADLTPLRIATKALFPSGATLAVILPQGDFPLNVEVARDEVLFAIYDDRAQVLVCREGLGLEFPTAPAINPGTVHGLCWPGGELRENAFISLAVDRYRAWRKKKVVSVPEYQGVVKNPPPVEWLTVNSYAESIGITPIKMLGFMKAILLVRD